MNPFHVLGLTPAAKEEEIRQAYLEAVRNSPPESDPERFAAVSRAYQSIKDERSRIRTLLFDRECPGDSPIDALVRHGRLQGPPRPPALEDLKQFLRRCAEE